ncbi:hypothetical protein ACJMK2_029352 [Sinanodonta woodiana]|uniref:Reverse transcriptase domain-containing protein n=1 Tax=Sinanodonta woodiana TaxID=1069815 RepID=A0ABD3X9W8_SINWO
MFTADTGATKTIIADRVYNQIPEEKRPPLKKSVTLAGAGGILLKELRKATFHLELGPLLLDMEVIVAKIEDEGLLGIDILKGVIKLHGISIPCIQIGLNDDTVRNVKATDDFIIPGNSEAIIYVFVDRMEEDGIAKQREFLIEPSENNFTDKYSLIVAPAIVDTKDKVTQKLRLLNPYLTSVSINQDTCIGQAYRHDGIQMTLFDTEDNEETKFTTEGNLKRADIKRDITVGNDSCCIPEHLQDLYVSTVATKGQQELKVIADLLNKFANTFSRDDNDLELTKLIEHSIDTNDAKPVKQPQRRVPMAFTAEEKKAIQELDYKGVIQKSTSPWASPIVLDRKKNGQVRPCVDYRQLNAVTVKDTFPLPRVHDCLDAVAGAESFSTLDLTSGYHQIPVRGKDIPKTAFVTKYGFFEYKTMPMGLTGAPGTFQRLVELIIQGLQWQTCLIYIDDIIVFGENFEEHMSRLEKVLQRIQNAGLKLKPDKCRLLQHQVEFLGHIVSKEGVKTCPMNIMNTGVAYTN